MRTGFVTDDLFALHDTGSGHPERPERLRAVRKRLAPLDLQPIAPRDAARAEILAAHQAAYVDSVAERIRAGARSLDADTVVCAKSLPAAIRAAGAGLALGEAWLAGEIEAGFACVRPPGHHATPGRAMGFCLFNNIAILARFLQAQGKRVAILDWDVHHGNGTQDIFWDDPAIGFLSLHQSPLWPGSGRRDETGAGNIKNVPMPPGSGDAEYLAAFEREVEPWLAERDPDVLLVSAGFDAHRSDPLANQLLSTEAFAEFTRHILGRPILSLMEGGYDLEALASSAAAHVGVLIDS